MQAKYTECLVNLINNKDFKPLIDEALSKYPLYTPVKAVDMIPDREQLNQKLLNHYKYREIAFETPGRFLDELEIVMCEIMPRYNELYKTVEIMNDLPSPFDNVDVIETFEETKTGSVNSNVKSTSESSGSDTTNSNTSGTSNDESTINGTSNNTNDSKNVKSNTPGSLLDIGTTGINSVNYADEVTWNQDKNTGTNNTTSSNTGETSATSSTNSNTTANSEAETIGLNTTSDTTTHTFTKKGNQGVNTYAHDMIEFRESIIDITTQIVNDERIKELFLMVY